MIVRFTESLCAVSAWSDFLGNEYDLLMQMMSLDIVHGYGLNTVIQTFAWSFHL